MGVARTGNTGVLTAKGDIAVVNASGDIERLPVGADGKVLTAQASDPSGLTYVDGQRIIYMGGALMTVLDVGKYFEAQATSGGVPGLAVSSDTEMICGMVGVLRRITWRTASGAAGSTTFKILKDGTVVWTFVLPATNGSAAAPTGGSVVTVVNGNGLSVEYNAGTAPGRSTIQLWAG
jgi:hypothetical protein